MTPVADLRRPAFALQWHEAVAVVAELADTMRASGLARVPTPESILITVDGTLHADVGTALEGLPSRELAGLLGGLLSVSCPPEVKQFVTGNLTEPPAQATLEAFADALAFFERPGRRGIVQAVAARAAEVENEARADDELEKLAARARAKQVEEPGVPPQDAPSRPRKRGVARRRRCRDPAPRRRRIRALRPPVEACDAHGARADSRERDRAGRAGSRRSRTAEGVPSRPYPSRGSRVLRASHEATTVSPQNAAGGADRSSQRACRRAGAFPNGAR